jgi:hypothetical protein
VKHSPMDRVLDLGISGAAIDALDVRSLLVDSAISHCEKLRRVLELEGWIREARDCPLLERASERWQSEREQLIAELELSH